MEQKEKEYVLVMLANSKPNAFSLKDLFETAIPRNVTNDERIKREVHLLEGHTQRPKVHLARFTPTRAGDSSEPRR